MDYLNLLDNDFVVAMLDLYKIPDKNGDSKVYDFLKASPEIMDRLKRLYDEGFIRGTDRTYIRNFISMYDSYCSLSKLSDMINCCDYYSSIETKLFLNDFFKKATFDSKFLKGMKFFSSDEQKKLSFIVENLKYIIEERYSEIGEFNLFGDKYNDIINLFNSKLNLYRNNCDLNEFYSSFDSDFSFKNFYDYVMGFKRLYFQSFICRNNEIGADVFNDFCFNDFIDLIHIDYDDFYKPFKYSSSVDFSNIKSSDYQSLFSLLDSINIFSKEGKPIEYFIDYLVNDSKITIDCFEDKYAVLLQNFYYIKNFLPDSRRDCVDHKILDRNLNLVEIYRFNYICLFYREITTRSKKLASILLSDKNNLDDFIRIAYESKFFNNVSYSKFKHDFIGNIYACNNFSDREKLISFVEGYHKFYDERKSVDSTKKNNFESRNNLRRIESYVSHVRKFLDGGYETLEEFYNHSSIDKRIFSRSLNFLSKINHPVFTEYTNFMEEVQKKKNFVFVTKLLDVVDGIKNGVRLPDGSVKKFDLIDYYSYTNMSIDDFLSSIKNKIPSGDFNIVSRYLKKYRNDKPITENGLKILMDTMYSYAIDSDYCYCVTIEDKNNVLLILRERGIPVTSITFSIMLRDFVMRNYSNDSKKKIK